MATYRKRLRNRNGDFIIPALNGDETGWIQTNDVADEAITTSKIADGAVTNAKIDWSSMSVAWGNGTLNTTYFSSGTVQWRKVGRIVVVSFTDLKLITAPPQSSGTLAVSNLPTNIGQDITFILISNIDGARLRLIKQGNNGNCIFHWSNLAGTSQEISGELVYIAA